MSRIEIEKEYDLKSLAGSGSAGLVYRAIHRVSGEEVAIKEFPAGKTPFSSILQELSFLFSTRHPHLVSCRNLLYGGYGRSYLVMEYATRGSLRDLINRRGAIDAQTALGFAEQVLEGLAHLHSEGIIHCDLKPENILCFPQLSQTESVDDNDLLLKIADFGVSVWTRQSGDTNNQGSPVYMAPEQFYDKVTPASDIYSLGAILFELAAGSFLFEGDSPTLFTQHLKAQPDWSLVQDERLRELCKALLKKDPYERPANADEALFLLRSLSGSQPTRQIPTRWEWFDLDFVRQPADKTILSLPVPGATRAFALPTGDFLVAHQNGNDLLSAKQCRLSPNRLLEPALAVSHPLPDGSVFVACLSWIGLFTAVGKWIPLFRPLCRIRALEYCPETRTLLLADSKNVKLCTTSGDLILSLPLANYFLDPSVCLWRDGFLATSGPSQPSCLVCHTSENQTSHQWVPLPAPALAATYTDNGTLVVTFPASADEEALLLQLEGSQWKTIRELEPGLLGARFQGRLLVKRYSSSVVTSAIDGSERSRHELDGTPLDAVWNFRSRQLLVIVQKGLSTEVSVRRETTEIRQERLAS